MMNIYVMNIYKFDEYFISLMNIHVTLGYYGEDVG